MPILVCAIPLSALGQVMGDEGAPTRVPEWRELAALGRTTKLDQGIQDESPKPKEAPPSADSVFRAGVILRPGTAVTKATLVSAKFRAEGIHDPKKRRPFANLAARVEWSDKPVSVLGKEDA